LNILHDFVRRRHIGVPAPRWVMSIDNFATFFETRVKRIAIARLDFRSKVSQAFIVIAVTPGILSVGVFRSVNQVLSAVRRNSSLLYLAGFSTSK
jgi:hypothetical protein